MNIKELKAVYTANLRTLRTQKKLSQAEISEKVHITEKFYSDLETGRKCSCTVKKQATENNR